MKPEAIAKVCHEVNRAYCQSLGDSSQPEWDEAPAWMKDSALHGVEHHIRHPNTTPEGSHEKWLEEKRATGWKYGSVKDAEKKEHPCFVPYAELKETDKAKDYIFRAVVKALATA